MPRFRPVDPLECGDLSPLSERPEKAEGRSSQLRAHSLPPTAHRPLPTALASFLVAFLTLAPRPALAHKLYVFATADGKTISGQAYVRDGQPVREAIVNVLAPDGTKFGEVKTDAEGNFTFAARFRCDHRLVVDGGEGHTAEYTVPARELPESLPTYAGGQVAADAPAIAESKPAAAPSSSVSTSAAASPSRSMEEQVHALSDQIRELRQDLARYQDALRFQDVLGGLGYILGLMGLAYYFLGAKRKTPPRP